MEVPLTPLEFARRARRLYPTREAVVDGDRRLTYGEFFDRCDQWSIGAAGARREAGRPGRLHRAEHARAARVVLCGAADRRGARPGQLPADADDFAYIINHSGARVVCAHDDYLGCGRPHPRRDPAGEHFVALEGSRPGWLDYEQLASAASPEFKPVTIGERDLLTINYTSGTTRGPRA